MNQDEEQPVVQAQEIAPEAPLEPGPQESQAERKTVRRKTIRFVATFVISVFTLLTAHEFFKNTLANDYYLFQVSRSTTFLLSHIGFSSYVIGHPRTFKGKEAWVRASLQAWARGEEAPSAEKFDGAEASPLNPWESWIYSAQSARRELAGLKKQYRELEAKGELQSPAREAEVQELVSKIQKLGARDLGPTVGFTLKPGLSTKIAEARKDLADINANTSLPEAERGSKSGQAKARLDDLIKQRDLIKDQPDAHLKMADMSFNFVVVPDCGAIPSMIIFIAAIIAFPTVWWKHLAGLALGLPILYFVNVLRLTFLAVLGAWDHGGAIFKFTHEYIWQGIYIIFVVAVWLAWVEFFVRRKKA